MQKGDIQIIESSDSEKYYIVLKMDVLETDEYFLSAKDSLLYEMKSEDFDALITQWTEAQNVVKNQDAYTTPRSFLTRTDIAYKTYPVTRKGCGIFCFFLLHFALKSV